MSSSTLDNPSPLPTPGPARARTPQGVSGSGASRSSGGGGGWGDSSKPDLLARISSPRAIAEIVLLLSAIAWLFHNWFVAQNEYSSEGGDWSHVYMVPFISIYLLWQKRDEVARQAVEVFWPGLIPLLMGVVCYVFFIVNVPNHMGQGLSLVLTVFGVVLLLLGPGMMRFAFWPIAFLVFGITIAERIMIAVTFRLQQWAAVGSFIGMKILGMNVVQRGTVLEVIANNGDVHPLNIEQQCSGMRMLIAFIALGAAVALVATGMWWKRIVLVALAAPVALLLNIGRVMVLGVATLYDSNLVSGEAHTFIGTILLVPGFILYMLIILGLNKAVPEQSQGMVVKKKAKKKLPAAKGATT